MTGLTRRNALKLATVGVASIAGTTAASAAQTAAELKGTWKYQSSRPDPGSLAANHTSPVFVA